jgi:UDP-N-acetylglucosamine 2-epimerase (non-hydrolysing)
MNRQLTSKITRYHFAPTKLSRNNLIKENIEDSNIAVTGNTVIDSLFYLLKKIENTPTIKHLLSERIEKSGYPINRTIEGNSKRIVLITSHRRENFGKGVINICEALKLLASNHPQIDIVYPVHLNPNVREPVNKMLSGISSIYLIEPLDYEPFVYLMSRSYIILTDSGGIQEEAPSIGKPVLVMRDTTERPEAVVAGTVKLVGTEKLKIIQETEKLLNDKQAYSIMSKAHNPYGDGRACHRIVEYLRRRNI